MPRLLASLGIVVCSFSQLVAGGRPREPHGSCWSPARKAFAAPCGPGNEMCGPAWPTTKYHIMDTSCPGLSFSLPPPPLSLLSLFSLSLSL